jgi:hypothetical protein
MDNEWVIDLNGIKARERAALNAALTSGDDEQAYVYFARVIKVWPFKQLDPAKPESYGELGLAEHTEVVRRFALSFQALGAAIAALANSGETAGEGH